MNNNEYNITLPAYPHHPSQFDLFQDGDSLSDLQAPCLRYEVGEVMMNDHKFVGLFCNDELVEVHVEKQVDGNADTLIKWTQDCQLGDTVH